jgi:hypothetical protein
MERLSTCFTARHIPDFSFFGSGLLSNRGTRNKDLRSGVRCCKLYLWLLAVWLSFKIQKLLFICSAVEFLIMEWYLNRPKIKAYEKTSKPHYPRHR